MVLNLASGVAPMLVSLFGRAQEAEECGVSTADSEPAFVQLLQYIQENPECREEAVLLFRDEVRKGAEHAVRVDRF